MHDMRIDFAFFAGDDLLTRGSINFDSPEPSVELNDDKGHSFHIVGNYGDPSCAVEIICLQHQSRLYRANLDVPLHDSEDWESIDLAGIHTLGFRCTQAT